MPLFRLSLPAAPPYNLGTGTWLYVDPFLVTVIPSGTSATGFGLTLPVPNTPSLVGAQLALQAMLFPGTAAVGLDWSQSVLLTLGR